MLWNNSAYPELAKIQYAPKWQAYGITHVRQVFTDNTLLTFSALQAKFGLPQQMHFYYLQLQHAVAPQHFSNCYSRLLRTYLYDLFVLAY